MFAVYLFVSSPSSLSVDPGTDAAQEPDDTVDDRAFGAEQPGKNPSVEHAYIAYSFSLMLALKLLQLLFILF
jgi:hypothetical protein